MFVVDTESKTRQPKRSELRARRRRARVEEAATPAEQLAAAYDVLRASLHRRAKRNQQHADETRTRIAQSMLDTAERLDREKD